MKKNIVVILIMIYFSIANSCFAISELYCIKSVNKADLTSKLETVMAQNKYLINKKDPYLVISDKGNEQVVVLLQKNYSDIYYYFESDKNNKLNKKILKALKKNKITYEKIENATYTDSFLKLSSKVKNPVTEKKAYDFSTPVAKVTVQPKEAQKSFSSTTLKGYVGQVSAGTTIGAYLQDSINTATIVKGEDVIAVLTSDWAYNGQTIAPQGSMVYGVVTKAQSATYGYKNGSVQIDFNKIQTPQGKTYNVVLEKVDFQVDSEGKGVEILKKTGTPTALGAVAGMVIGSSSSNMGSATLIGAGVGLAAGLLMTAMEKGIDAEIPALTQIDLVLIKPLDVVLSY